MINCQRHRCKDCGKTFVETPKTPIYRSKKSSRWLEFIECMLLGLSLRKSVKKMNDISPVCLFYWRHKILTAISQIKVKIFEEIAEMDETYFFYSEKCSREIR